MMMKIKIHIGKELGLKIALVLVLGLVFTIMNLPAWVLGSLISKYSGDKVGLYNETGTFWQGSGMLVAKEVKLKNLSPLIVVDWNVSFGLSKFVDVKFTAGSQTVADVSVSKSGLLLEQLNLALSLSQITPLLDQLNTLGLSGVANVTSNSIKLGSTNSGTVNLTMGSVGSNMSPLNPVGSYQATFVLDSGDISVQTTGSAIINVSGNGNLKQGLTLSASIDPDKKDQMLQFITTVGMPQADGSYLLKLF